MSSSGSSSASRVRCVHVVSSSHHDAVVSAKKGVVAERQDAAERLWAVVSPQTYPRAALAKAYPKAAKNRKNYEDDLAAALAQGISPRLVPTAAISLRIRSAEDLAPALALMK